MFGVICYKGMIFWDDDIDIFFYCEDYECLLKIIEEEDYLCYKVLFYDIFFWYFYNFVLILDIFIVIEDYVKYKCYDISFFIDVFLIDCFIDLSIVDKSYKYVVFC